ncbi:MAG TPA: phosphate ABC transporter permease subunit PstC [Thermoanaerobaculia bacterium]|nr:phosphate ABC transporter permease subunit PstC [Thermoanaerobaculia bacterium]
MSSVTVERIRRGRIDSLRYVSFALSAVAAAAFLGLVVLFAVEALPFARRAGWGALFAERWSYRTEEFGALPMIYGSLAVSSVALAIAGPIGLGAAVFLAEVLPRRARIAGKVGIELLAGIPSVVYGLLGVLLLRDWMLRPLARWDPLSGDTLATGGVLLAVMIVPTVASLADDALAAVPRSQRWAARALGIGRAGAILRVVVPQALPGLFSALLLGLGRALGETVAVFLVIGRQDNQWPERLLSVAPLAAAGQTVTSKLGGSETFVAYGAPVHWGALLALGLLLLAVVAAISFTGSWLALRRVPRA